jgi:hypothetical protein
MLYMPVRNKQEKVESKISKVFFLGRDSECNKDRRIIGWSDDFGFGQGFGDLIGFATDLQNLLDFFHKQHSGLQDNFVEDRFQNPEKMVEHIRELMFKNIPENNH